MDAFVDLSFTLPEAPLVGSVFLVFTAANGTNHTLNLSSTFNAAATYNLTLRSDNLSGTTGVVGVVGPNALFARSAYTVVVRYRDASSFPANSSTPAAFTYGAGAVCGVRCWH